ncbi:MAG: GatB/YqeY domain-containing protein [Candidatus Zixiibacteriota bacterium]
MSLKERITEDMKVAMKEGDKAKLNLIRMLRSEIRYKEIELGSKLDDNGTIYVLSSAVKKRKEAIEEFKKGGREDLVAREEEELRIVFSYLPEQLSEQELLNLIDDSIAEVEAQSPMDVGKVMKVIMPKVKGRADGKKVNQMVSLKLQEE